jgi:hypothetical protein
MQHAEVLEAVRRLVRRTFVELGVGTGCPMSEHILVRDDFYCGRQFHADGLQAIWFIEEDELKIHARDGSVARVISASEALRPDNSQERKAA